MEKAEDGTGFLYQPLTRRERNILAHLSNYKSSQEIAGLETLAYSSVKWYIHQVYAKLGVNRRSEAITRARKLGLLQPEPVALVNALVIKNNLPRQLTSFIGREDEIMRLLELVQELPLVTLTGSGGVGKTRLSLQVAQEMVERFEDGVWLVELAAVTDPGMVPQAVASTLGLKSLSSQSIREILLGYLHGKQILLVLDNCEHLVEACASLADELLQVSQRLKILASSREALRVAGEILFHVPSMTLPDPAHLPELAGMAQFEAVRLLNERACAVRPDFRVTAQNAPAVAQICQRLDGIPLAIELAAARLTIMTPEQLLQHLQNAFHLLTGGARTALPRQQTLRATIDWSYRLLSKSEKKLLRRLAVFTGSFDLAAVEAVGCLETGESLDVLASLANKSMLAVEPQPGQEIRYRLLETMRQYAREKLDDSGESLSLHDAHADYYLKLAKEVGRNIFTRQAPNLLRRLNADFPNVRAGFIWALEGQAVEQAIEALLTLWFYWLLSGSAEEGRALLEKALGKVDAQQPSVARADLLRDLGFLSEIQGREREAIEKITLSWEMSRKLGDRRGYAWSCLWMGTITFREYSYYEESAAIHKELGDEDSRAFTVWLWGTNSRNYGDLDQSERLLEESERFYLKNGSWFLGAVYFNQAYLYFLKGQLQRARSLFIQALPLIQAVDDQWDWMWWHWFKGNMDLSEATDGASLRSAEAVLMECIQTAEKFGNRQFFLFSTPILLAKKAQELREYAMAVRRYRETLTRYRNLFPPDWMEDNDISNIGQCILGLAEAAIFLDNAAYSARLLGALEGLRETEKDVWKEITPDKFSHLFSRALSALGEINFQSALAEGRTLTLKQAVAYAVEEKN
jgi:predicted ATPase/DNA-binding CsgD family transcriptional regulator